MGWWRRLEVDGDPPQRVRLLATGEDRAAAGYEGSRGGAPLLPAEMAGAGRRAVARPDRSAVGHRARRPVVQQGLLPAVGRRSCGGGSLS